MSTFTRTTATVVVMVASPLAAVAEAWPTHLLVIVPAPKPHIKLLLQPRVLRFHAHELMIDLRLCFNVSTAHIHCCSRHGL
jgi:hypothetical protein